MEENPIERLMNGGFGLQVILDQVPVGIVLSEAPSGRILFGNKQVEVICGHPVRLSPNKKAHSEWIAYHANGQRVLSNEYPMVRTLETGERNELEVHYQRGDGTRKWIRITSAPIQNSQGVMLGAIVALIDIDAQRQSTDELRRVRERLEAAINIAELGIWTWQVGGPVIADGNMATWFGFTEGDGQKGIPLERLFDRVHNDDRPQVQEALDKALATGGCYTPECRIVGPDNEVRWIAIRGKVQPDTDGHPRSLNGAVLDITDLRRTENALRESEERFRTLSKTIPQLIWSATPEGDVDFFSEQWAEFTGVNPADFLEWRWQELIHPDDLAETIKRWTQCIQTGEPYEINQRLRHHSGEWRWLLTRGRALRNTNGQIYKWVGTSTDIHEQLMIERELRRLNADLEGFSFAAAHDLQEPLRMVSSFTQLLAKRLEGRLDEDDHELMDYVVTGAKRISLLIQDLLSYTSLSRTSERPKEKVDLNRAVQRALEHLSSIATETGAVVFCQPLPQVDGYEAQYVQLFQNLISNAIKYRSTRPPKIQIQAERKGSTWIVSVKDNGMGIDAAYHKHVFGIFKRLHGQKIPGTGIGLAICQRVVERNGGQIWVESAGEGQGSTFCFSIPAADE